MNKEWIMNHINEAKQELENIINEINDEDYESINFETDMHHACYHLNLAYNTNKMGQEEIDKLSKKEINNLIHKKIDLYSLE